MLVAFGNADQQLVALWVIRGVTPSPSPSPQHLKTLQKRFFLGGKTEEFTPTTMTVTKCTRIACQVILLVNMTLRTLIVSKLFGLLLFCRDTCVPLAGLLQTDRRWRWWWCTIVVRPTGGGGVSHQVYNEIWRVRTDLHLVNKTEIQSVQCEILHTYI